MPKSNNPTNYSQLLNAYIGSRIKKRRQEVGLSQERVGEKLEVSYQQIQKYEAGINRVSPEHLVLLSQVLETTVMYFFEGIPKPPSL